MFLSHSLYFQDLPPSEYQIFRSLWKKSLERMDSSLLQFYGDKTKKI